MSQTTLFTHPNDWLRRGLAEHGIKAPCCTGKRVIESIGRCGECNACIQCARMLGGLKKERSEP